MPGPGRRQLRLGIDVDIPERDIGQPALADRHVQPDLRGQVQDLRKPGKKTSKR